jgi:hypothetical protein
MRMAKLVSLGSVAILAACAGTGWRARQIDGSTAATVEISVALLRNALPPARRERIDVALGVIFMQIAANSAGDLNGDGEVNDLDAREISDTATALWTEIARGNLVGAVEEHGDDFAAAYFKRLDGLAYDELLELAGEANDEYLAAVRRLLSSAGCAERRGRTLGRINDGCD